MCDFIFHEGKADLRLEEKEPGAGEVQVRAGLQDQGAEEADRAARDGDQGEEGADPADGVRAGAHLQEQRGPRPQHQAAQAEAQGHRERDARRTHQGQHLYTNL